MKVPVARKSGQGTPHQIEVTDAVFRTEVPDALLAQAVRTQSANRRLSSAHTKRRGEVSGGGRKPWRQKGTGRARAGSIRSPLWRGGGVTFGPTPQMNFSLKMPARMRRQALLGALSRRFAEQAVAVIPDFSIKKPSTKEFLNVIRGFDLELQGTVLVIPEADEVVLRSSDNVAGLTMVTAPYLSTFLVLSGRRIVFTESGLARFSELFGTPGQRKGRER